VVKRRREASPVPFSIPPSRSPPLVLIQTLYAPIKDTYHIQDILRESHETKNGERRGEEGEKGRERRKKKEEESRTTCVTPF
jgi:hypothetical protein